MLWNVQRAFSSLLRIYLCFKHRPSLLDLERNASVAFTFGHPLLLDGWRPTSYNFVHLGKSEFWLTVCWIISNGNQSFRNLASHPYAYVKLSINKHKEKASTLVWKYRQLLTADCFEQFWHIFLKFNWNFVNKAMGNTNNARKVS